MTVRLLQGLSLITLSSRGQSNDLMEEKAPVDFFTASSMECQQRCIEDGNHFFLSLDELYGRCCDLTTHAVEGCSLGGIDTLDIAFKYRFQGAGTLMCP